MYKRQLVKKGIIRTFQITEVFLSLTVYENLRVAVETAMGLNIRPWISRGLRAAINRRVDELMDIVNIAPKAHRIVGEMSHEMCIRDRFLMRSTG